MRVDFNVPQDKKTGAITNTQRIVGAMPTIKMALDKGAKAVILMSHLGRPDGRPQPSMTLKPVAEKLGELMGKPVTFLPACVGADTEAACANPAEGSIILIENLRWHVEEEGKGKSEQGDETTASEKETDAFRASLSKLGDVFVNDAFGTAHRAHSSMVGMKGKMPCVAGLLVAKELDAFAQVLDPSKVQRPLTAIVGGAKIKDKVLVIENLLDKADKLILCGGMAYTFMKVHFGMEIGKSLFDKKGAELVPILMEKAAAKGVEIVLPCDWACGQDFKNDQEIKMVTKEEGIPEGWEGMDCGPKSMALFRDTVLASKTVVWNGPAGVFEFDNFSKGTKSLLEAVAELTQKGGRGIIGGGDSATAAAKWNMEDKVHFVSTGGGASLELLEGKVLPGIAALDGKEKQVMTLDKATIADLDVKGKRVLMRVDFNVPQDKKTGAITNTQRIVGAMPTIKMALDKGAKAVILMSHLGRPDGRPQPSMTLKPVAEKLGELMGKPVTFLPACVGADTEAACANPAEGSIILIENLRWHVEEEGKGKSEQGDETTASEKETDAFRASLSKLGDVFVNDAFGTAHRAHSSMVGMKGKMPCVAGLLVAKELDAFAQVLDPSKVQRPLTAIVGGAKIKDKVLVIENLLDKADKLILCGGMAYTFMKVHFGMEIGKSLFDKKGAELVPILMEKAAAKGVEIVLPCDWACGQDFKNDQEIKMVTKEEGIPEGWEGMDCGPKSMALFRDTVLASKTVVWNGPAGVFEFDNFSKGTKSLLEAVAELTQKGGRGIIGGGDSATAAAKWNMEDKVHFVSTGGGASLELLEGKVLPGIAALDDLS